MTKRWWMFLMLFIMPAVVVVSIFTFYQPVYMFEGTYGPAEPSSVQAPVASFDRYAGGTPSRLAILITDEKSGWLSLVHGLKTIGIPLRVTRDHTEAFQHKVVIVYPTISGATMSQQALRAVAAHARSGGVVIASEVLGGGLEDLFGFTRLESARGLKSVRIDATLAGVLSLDGQEELELPLSTPGMQTGSYKLAPGEGKVLARYDDGSAAILTRDHATGRTYIFGFDLGDYMGRSFNGRQQGARRYVNAYEPGVDILYRILLHIYQEFEPLAVTIDTVPEGKSASMIVTHDIDYTRSIKNAIKYAEYEKSIGVAATYFIQTKYVRDWSDEIFYNQEGADYTRRLHAMGMEVGSHSVSHSKVFSKFPIGNGDEVYPQYLPFVKSMLSTHGGTVLGELRISGFLLEKTVPGLDVVSFRPGHLQYPTSLAQTMEATGYKYSSSMTTGLTLTHLPFQLSHNRDGVTETGVYEFPITIEDELQRPMTDRLDAAKEILKKLQRYGGMMVVLIHPNVFEDKMDFLKQLLPYAKSSDVWMGSLGQFGAWWAARDQVGVDVRDIDGKTVLEVNAPESGANIILRLPPGMALETKRNGRGDARQRGDRLHLTGIAGSVHFSMIRTKAARIKARPLTEGCGLGHGAAGQFEVQGAVARRC